MEEKAAQAAADLTEEATRLYKALDVLGLGEKAHKESRLCLSLRLKEVALTQVWTGGASGGGARPGLIAREVDALVGRAEAAMGDFFRRMRASPRWTREKREKVRAIA